ncbi:MAG: PhaM family polyhydroxyalkanoate granule multifunctional regulatory protein [Polaromonas sp.]
MSSANTPSFPDFGKLVPGFDFLQNLAKQAAGSATQSIPQLPNLGNWIAPTLNVEELDKRIQELKAVQFWLDQNAAALKATIQALEVQKMTLATLKGMNFNMGDVANAFKLKVADSVAGGMQRATDKARTFSGLEVPPSHAAAARAAAAEEKSANSEADKPTGKTATADAAPAAAFVDPMKWWGALTQQFQTIAADTMKEAAKKGALDATKKVATGLAQEAVKTATDMAKGMADSATKSVTGGARAAMDTALRSTQGWTTPAPTKTAAKTAAKPAAKPPAKPKAEAPARKAARKTPR